MVKILPSLRVVQHFLLEKHLVILESNDLKKDPLKKKWKVFLGCGGEVLRHNSHRIILHIPTRNTILRILCILFLKNVYGRGSWSLEISVNLSNVSLMTSSFGKIMSCPEACEALSKGFWSRSFKESN